jgi:site-specific recombinase XerD
MSITQKHYYQEGSLTRVSRAKGPDVWAYRWREPGSEGRRVHRRLVIGDVDRFPTEAAAKRAVEQLRVEINAEQAAVGKVTVKEAWEHYQANELRNPEVDRSPTTIELYLSNFRNHIIPRWGDTFLTDVKAVQVEAWLRGLSMLAPSTRSKLRNQLSSLYSHAIRFELFDRLNPISSVRQGAKRLKTPDILTLEEMTALVRKLEEPSTRAMVLVAAVTGLRRSEIRGLQWHDIDFDKLWLNLRRGKVRCVYS